MSYVNIIFSRFDFVLLQIILQEAEIMNQGKTVFAQLMSLIPRYDQVFFQLWSKIFCRIRREYRKFLLNLQSS